MLKEKAQHFVIYFLLLLGSCFALYTASCIHPDALNEDTYITLTFAKNLAAGNGFVYNQPPATLGTTTPLLALLLACVSKTVSSENFPLIAIFFTAFCWISIPWMMMFFRRVLDISKWQALIIGLMILSAGIVASIGMEIYLFSALLTASILLFLHKQYLTAGITAGLLFLTRGEGILMVPLFMLFGIIPALRENKYRELKAYKPFIAVLAGFLIPFLVWSIYAYLTFGKILPNTLYVKLAQQRIFPTTYGSFRAGLLLWPLEFAQRRPVFFMLKLSLILLGIFNIIKYKRPFLTFIVWILFYIIGYAILNPAAYTWYQYHIQFVFHIITALGIIQIISFLSCLKKQKRLMIVASIFLITLLVFYNGKATYKEASKLYIRANCYRELCQWMRDNTRPAESVAFSEIGYIGYYTDNKLIDFNGLVTPEMIPHLFENGLAWGMWHLKPDYYVRFADFDGFFTTIHNDEKFAGHYQKIYITQCHNIFGKEIELALYKRSN